MLISKSIGKENRLKFLYISFIFFSNDRKKIIQEKKFLLIQDVNFKLKKVFILDIKVLLVLNTVIVTINNDIDIEN